MSGSAAWADALQAMALFVADPVGLGGIAVRAGVGPVRERFLALLQASLSPGTPVRRLPLHISDDRLLGGLDLAATLQAGKPVAQLGLLAEADGGVVLLPMAERIDAGLAVRLRMALDDGAIVLQREGLSRVVPARFGVVALDEGMEPDEHVPAALLDRLAFHLDLTRVSLWDITEANGSSPRAPVAPGEAADVAPGQWQARGPERDVAEGSLCMAGMAGGPPSSVMMGGGAVSRFMAGGGPASATWLDTNPARREWQAGARHDDGSAPDVMGGGPSTGTAALDGVDTLCQVAAALGIASLRAPLLALRVARAVAGLSGRATVSETDLVAAARLVLAPRATQAPTESDAPDDLPPPPEDVGDEEPQALPDQPLADVVLDAAKAALPIDLLAQLAEGGGTRSLARAPGRTGQVRVSVKRGRPVGIRQGEPRNGARLHLLETLKAAAPWQKLRRRTDRFEVRREDFRIVRFRQHVGTTTVFTVDASGSAAMHRLAEAKGAVELLLADCYVRRDQVALIAFRGNDATLLLPPTGSLLRAKRSLAALPGGGATPLAAGIEAAAHLADTIRRSGRTPVIAMLTDARANIARDGSSGRAQAEADAIASARSIGAAGLSALLVDTSPRPNPFARRLADAMCARYVPLPYAEANALSRAVRAASAA